MLNTWAESVAGFVEMFDELRGRLGSWSKQRTDTVAKASTDPQGLPDNLNELVSVAHEFSDTAALQKIPTGWAMNGCRWSSRR